MPKCERCKTNDARVRIDQIVAGKRESRYLCENCAQEVVGNAGGANLGANLGSIFGNNAGGPGTVTAERQSGSKTPVLDQFGRDLTGEAEDGKLDPTAGREREIRRVITVLARRQKNNPVLIGEPGVGKTAIVEGIARRIVEGNVPAALLGKRIIALSMGGMLAGAMFRGQFEERVKQVLEEVRENPDIVLFIDELHTVIGAGAAEGAVGAADMLKPALARGEVRCIGATTLDEYRQIERDAALERRFAPIYVDEPTAEEAVAMLLAVRPEYESHHGVQVTDEAIDAAVTLSDRYISDRFLPDKAIDVIDEAASALRLDASESGEGPEGVAALEQRLNLLQQQKEQAALAEEYERAAQLRQQELLLQRELEAARATLTEAAPLIVSPELVARVIEDWTGVPVTEMVESERENLLNLEEDLTRRVIGQNEAITVVSRAIRRSRAGLKDPRRPIGSFLFLGPTGVGKTELARALAAEIFGNDDAMIRLDMSEYMEPHSVSKLFGSPPGYVGYGEGGQLTEQVRRRPYSVVLFDEIEKAHPEVFNALLQIMDDGRLTDGQGRTIDFKNTLVIMTSNVGSVDLKRAARIGFVVGADGRQDAIKDKALEGLKRAFRPEFLNRIDQVVVFRSLEREDLRRIVDLLLDDVQERLTEQQITLTVGDEARDFLLAEGYDEEFGARPLRRAIQRHVDDALADAILNGSVQNGATVALRLAEGALTIEIAPAEPEPVTEQAS
ncbi:MAG TPA: AAA family ATPase [Chloroflexota bacterium]|nr:AAA family ATPase [Chloroflexota bacterium]